MRLKILTFLSIVFASFILVSPANALDSKFFNPPSLFPKPTFLPGPVFSPKPTPTTSPTPAVTSNPTTNPSPTPTSPTITKISPTTVDFMQEFTITGFAFGNNPGSINFINPGGWLSAGAVPTSWSNTQIKAKVPFVAGDTRYEIQIITQNGKSSNKVKLRVDDGQPQINGTSFVFNNGKRELTLEGVDFGSRRGKINLHNPQTAQVIALGDIKSWSSRKVRFEFPTNLHGEVGYQIETSDGRLSSLKYINLP